MFVCDAAWWCGVADLYVAPAHWWYCKKVRGRWFSPARRVSRCSSPCAPGDAGASMAVKQQTVAAVTWELFLTAPQPSNSHLVQCLLSDHLWRGLSLGICTCWLHPAQHVGT